MYRRPVLIPVDLAVATACCNASAGGNCGAPPSPPPPAPPPDYYPCVYFLGGVPVSTLCKFV